MKTLRELPKQEQVKVFDAWRLGALLEKYIGEAWKPAGSLLCLDSVYRIPKIKPQGRLELN